MRWPAAKLLHEAGDGRYRIEFSVPDAGVEDLNLQLKDLSLGGMSFLLGETSLGLEFGTHVEKVSVHLGEDTVHGDFVVVHLTPDERGDTVCGVLFYPATDADLTT